MEGIISCPSPNFGVRRNGAKIGMLLLHYTDMNSADEALDRMCDPDSQVSAHYLVTPRGYVYQMVDENDRAWHAGVSHWNGVSDINSCSIGIELANPGHSNGYVPFPQRQMDSLAILCREIMERHDIPDRYLLGHSDVAPGRKIDPGELFDWRWLAGEGVGLWPETGPAEGDAVSLLKRIGYDVADPKAALSAFQRRYRPDAITGEADEETLSLMNGLLVLG